MDRDREFLHIGGNTNRGNCRANAEPLPEVLFDLFEDEVNTGNHFFLSSIVITIL